MAHSSQHLTTNLDQRLIPVYKSDDRVWNAIAIDGKGRFFVGFPQSAEMPTGVAEVLPDNSIKPYPTADWNATKAPPVPGRQFLRVNALRIGPDGYLWIVDAGVEDRSSGKVTGACLIVIDTQKNTIIKTHDLSGMVLPKSYIDDIRFENDWVYITDAGAPGLGLLNLKNGKLRRLLDHKESTTDLRDMYADGKVLHDPKGQNLRLHADQLEVSPDGRWLYFQPCSGPLYRVATAHLKDETLDDATLESYVEMFFNSPTTGGTAIDAEGNIYLNSTNDRRLLRITPQGRSEVILEDARLIWADAMWLDAEGWLWIPATQLNLTPGLNGGKMAVNFPIWIYKIQFKAKPPALDHA